VALELPRAASWAMSWAKRQVNAKLKNKDRAMEVGLAPVVILVVEAEMPAEVETSVVGELVEILVEAEVVTSAAEAVETSNTKRTRYTVSVPCVL